MAVGISASLVGVTDPQGVQVVATGLTIGQPHTITGSATTPNGVVTWPVRGGAAVATGTQAVLGDPAAPVNLPVRYTVTEGSGTATSAPITVPFTGRYLLQSLDGKVTARIRWRDNGDPRSLKLRAQTYAVPGRGRPVAVWDVAAGEEGTHVVTTRDEHTATLKGLLEAGGPILVRTDGTIRDLAPVEYILPTAATRTLTGESPGNADVRAWALVFDLLDDPEPDTVVVLSTWDDFDSVYAGSTGTAFDAEWAGQTGNQFDVEDWASRA